MNLILLVFIILAAMFIAISANYMLIVSNALDKFMAESNVPDYLCSLPDENDREQFKEFAENNGYVYQELGMYQTDMRNVRVDGKEFVYGSRLYLSPLSDVKVFDQESAELTQIGDGEIYVTAEIFYRADNEFRTGSTITVEVNGEKNNFNIKSFDCRLLYLPL